MFTHSVFKPVFQPVKKWVQQDPMEVFTHDVKKIKGTANKNGLKNATCKQSLKVVYICCKYICTFKFTYFKRICLHTCFVNLFNLFSKYSRMPLFERHTLNQLHVLTFISQKTNAALQEIKKSTLCNVSLSCVFNCQSIYQTELANFNLISLCA